MNKNGLPNGFLLRKSTRISVIFTNFAPNLKHFNTMAKLNRLKLVLVEKGKTGKWLAAELGKSNCTVSKWCNNINQPDLYTLERIAILLGVVKEIC